MPGSNRERTDRKTVSWAGFPAQYYFIGQFCGQNTENLPPLFTPCWHDTAWAAQSCDGPTRSAGRRQHA